MRLKQKGLIEEAFNTPYSAPIVSTGLNKSSNPDLKIKAIAILRIGLLVLSIHCDKLSSLKNVFRLVNHELLTILAKTSRHSWLF